MAGSTRRPARRTTTARGRLESELPPRRARRCDYVTGAALFARATTFRDVGLLPERYFMYYEETEWCLRARDAGWDSMVQPRARMTHLKRSGIGVPGPYAAYYLTRNRYFFARDCLGIDPELAMDQQERTWERNTRARVSERAPHWLPVFEELVDQAKRDARAGRDGRREDIEQRPSADDVLAGGRRRGISVTDDLAFFPDRRQLQPVPDDAVRRPRPGGCGTATGAEPARAPGGGDRLRAPRRAPRALDDAGPRGGAERRAGARQGGRASATCSSPSRVPGAGWCGRCTTWCRTTRCTSGVRWRWPGCWQTGPTSCT